MIVKINNIISINYHPQKNSEISTVAISSMIERSSSPAPNVIRKNGIKHSSFIWFNCI